VCGKTRKKKKLCDRTHCGQIFSDAHGFRFRACMHACACAAHLVWCVAGMGQGRPPVDAVDMCKARLTASRCDACVSHRSSSCTILVFARMEGGVGGGVVSAVEGSRCTARHGRRGPYS